MNINVIDWNNDNAHVFGNEKNENKLCLTVFEDHFMINTGRADMTKVMKLLRSENKRKITPKELKSVVLEVNKIDEQINEDFTDYKMNNGFDYQESEGKKEEQKFDHILYFDFETDISTNPHSEFQISFTKINKKIKIDVDLFEGKKCGNDFITYLGNNLNNGEKIILYAHNCQYDFGLIMSYLMVDNICTKDGQFYGASGKIMVKTKTGTKTIYVEFWDSYKLLSKPLRDLPEFLKLNINKEAYDYSLNTTENIRKRIIEYKQIKNEELRNEIKINCIELGF